MLTAVLIRKIPPMVSNSIFNVYNKTKERLNSFGIEDYGFEARIIIRHITGFDNKKILMNYNYALSKRQQSELEDILKKRQARYPLQYILGEWSFYGRTFKVRDGVLIPRQDTEVVVETALELIKDTENPVVADLCTGSGAIGITIALERPDSKVALVEKYDTPFNTAEENRRLNKAENAECQKGDVISGDFSDREYDLIVSNPPYVSQADMKILQPEVRFEPQEALCPGEDELLFYKRIIENYKKALEPGGKLCFEVGINQAQSVKELLSKAGFADVGIKKDYGEVDRVVFGTVK